MRKLFILLMVLLLAVATVPAFAQDGETQRFEGVGGLSFDYPAGWVSLESAGIVAVATDQDSLSTFTPANEDSVVVAFVVGTPTELAGFFEEEFDSLAGFREVLLTSLEDDGGTLLEDATLSLGGRDVFAVMGTSEGVTSLIYLVPLGDQAVFAIASGSDTNLMDTARPDLDAIIASIAFDPSVADVAPTPVTSVGTAPVSEGAFIFYQSLAQDIVDYVGLGTITSVVQLPDGSTFVDDTRSLWVLNMETGELSNRIENDDVFFIPEALTAAPDGTLWGFDYIDGLINLDTDLNVISASGSELFGESYVEDIAVAPDGTVFAFAPLVDAEFNSTGMIYVFNGAGELQSSFATNGEPDEFGNATFDYGIRIFPQDDGNLRLVDASLNSKVVDTAGNLISGPFRYGGDLGFIFAAAFDMAADGTVFLLTYEGTVQQFAPTGELIAEIGTSQANTDGPFSIGELPTYGDLLALDSNRVLLAGSNFTYGLVTLIDFSAAE